MIGRTARSSHDQRWFLLAMAIAVLPRLMLAIIALRNNPSLAFLGDGETYYLSAQNLRIHHSYFLTDPTGARENPIHTPGYPLILSALTTLDRRAFLVALFSLQVLCAAGALILLWKWARSFAPPIAVFAATLIFSLDWMSLAYTTRVMSETPFTFFLFLSCYLFWKAIRKNDRRLVLAAAFVFGWTTIVRQVAAYIMVLLAPVFRQRKSLGILFLVCSYSIPFLWVIRNQVVFKTASFQRIGDYHLGKFVSPGVIALDTGRPMEEVRRELGGKAHSILYLLAHHPVGCVKYSVYGVLKTIGASGIEMALDYAGLPGPQRCLNEGPKVTGEGTAALLKEYPWLRWPHYLYLGFLALSYLLWGNGLLHLWRAGEKLTFWFAGIIPLYLLFICFHVGTSRFRVPFMPFFALAAAAAFPFRFSEPSQADPGNPARNQHP